MTKPVSVPVAEAPVDKRRASSPSLRAQLEEAEQTLAAIRAGEVDAVVVGGPAGDRVFSLEGAEHRYRLLMDAMSEGVATLSDGGIVTYCNARFTAILGAKPELTVGNPIWRVVPGDGKATLDALIAASLRGRSEGEVLMKAPCAKAAALVRVAVVALTLDGARTYCLVMTDLTEQRRASAAASAERAQMQARLLLADRMASLGTLAAGVAHEINNPLTYTIASLELLRRRLGEPGGEEPPVAPELLDWLRRHATRAQEGADRVRLIVRDLKAFSRAGDDTLGVVDPRRAMDTALTMAANEIRHRATLVKDYATLPPVWASEARLGQVFLNLIMNAAQAIRGPAADNEIRVHGRTDDAGRAVVEVRDTGVGIDAEHLGLVFDPFFTTKGLDEGTGLGLSLCHAIVTSFGGEITVRSAPGKGTVFRVVLPAPPGPLTVPPPPMGPTRPSARRARLLVVDDEPDICDVLDEALAASHEVVTTTSARRALEMIASGLRFDLLLCDIRMPEMTGIDFHARLAVDHPDQASRVVLMSGGYGAARGGAPVSLPRPLLEKPFTIEQVSALLDDALSREPAA